MANIADKAMLVIHRQSKWEGRKYDAQVSAELCAGKGAESGTARVNKLIVPKEFIQPVVRAFNRAYSYHREVTLPWMDSGERVLTSAMYMEYTSRMAQHRAEIQEEVRVLCDRYPQVLQTAQQRLGKMYKASDFPDPATLPKLFSLSTSFLPLPVNDVRVEGVSEEELQTINEQKEREIEQALKGTVRELYERINQVVQRMSEGLQNYSRDPVTGKVERTFRDTLVTNVRDVVDLLPKLNFTNDMTLDGLNVVMRNALLQYEPEQLREDEAARQEVQKNAESIMEAMKVYMGEAA